MGIILTVNKANTIAWLRRYGVVISVVNSEVHMNCPKCGHSQFYFNASKGVGWCHRDSCHWRPSIKVLSDHWGSEPSDVGWVAASQIRTPAPAPQISLPNNALPVVEFNKTKYTTGMFEAYNWLTGRGLTAEQIYHWGIVANAKRIYVPIYYKGFLKQYVARAYGPWAVRNEPKYLYGRGVPVTDFLFGWDEQSWEWMTLVENTFVSMWLRDSVNCTTNFGSHLSDAQMGLIARSKIKEVIILWDEGAQFKASKAMKRLREHGVSAKHICIVGQPDDYPIEFIKEAVAMARLGSGFHLDMKEVCRALKRSS